MLSQNLYSMTKTKVVMTIQLSVRDGIKNEEMSYGQVITINVYYIKLLKNNYLTINLA